MTRLAEEEPENNATVIDVLEASFSDEDPGVRAQAVSGLARREAASITEVLRQALRDFDVSVRLVAVESIVPGGAGKTLLQEALVDSDASVRSLAAAKMEQFEAEQSRKRVP